MALIQEQDTIYIDLSALLKEVCKSCYKMENKDRIVYMDDVKKEIMQCLKLFVLGKRTKDRDRKIYYNELLDAEFHVVKVYLHILDDENVWRGPKDGYGVPVEAKKIFPIVAKIDEGIGKWNSYLIRGRVAPEIEGAAGRTDLKES